MTLAAFIERSHRDKEAWKYTDLESLLTKIPAPLVDGDARDDHLRQVGDAGRDAYAEIVASIPSPGEGNALTAARLVFLNGVFQQERSTFGSVPSCILMGDAKTGYELTLGEHTCLIAQPIEMVFACDDQAPRNVAIKMSITIGNNGRLTLLENHLASAAITTIETAIKLHPSAKFLHGKIVRQGRHVALAQVEVAQGGYYSNFALLRGGSPCRNEIKVRLSGEQAQAAVNGIMMLRDQEHADTTTCIEHVAPSCSSRQIYKSVLDGRSRGVFQGNIIVGAGAQKSDGYQLSRALLLSDQAEMDARPQLEINADDVKCSHGSTIGDLDEDALFYLRSRGLSEAEARALLIEAFVIEMLNEVQTEEWRRLFYIEMEAQINHGRAR